MGSGGQRPTPQPVRHNNKVAMQMISPTMSRPAGESSSQDPEHPNTTANEVTRAPRPWTVGNQHTDPIRRPTRSVQGHHYFVGDESANPAMKINSN